MAQPQSASVPRAPRGAWRGRLLLAPLASQLAVGAGIVALVMLAFVALEVAYGHLPPGADGGASGLGALAWRSFVFALILAYLPISWGIGARGAMRDTADIRPLLDCSDAEFRALETERRSWEISSRQHALGLAGVLLGALVSCGVAGPEAFFAFADWDHHFVWQLGLSLALFWGVGHIVYVSVSSSQFFSRLQALPLRLDLLDLRPLAPYVRTGLRNALLWVVGVSLSLLLFFGDGESSGHPTAVMLLILLLSSAITTLVFVLPVRLVHQRIRAEKRAELARVGAAIDGDRAALADSRLAAQAAELSLADLVAYRGLVQSASEWPFERSSVLRLGLYLAIPIGSWIGGALMERVLGAFLD